MLNSHAADFTSPQTKRLEARVNHDLHTLIKHAAQLEGRTLTDFIITALQTAAHKTIADTALLQLSVRDQQHVADILLSPPTPNTAMKKAMAQHQQLIQE